MDPPSKYFVVWKENYFSRISNIYEPRGPKYQCSECNEFFNTRLSIFTHSKIHLKPFCIVCGLYTKDLQDMQKHMMDDHRSMVDIMPVELTDINQNLAIVKNSSLTTKKTKLQELKKQSFGSIGNPKNYNKHQTKYVISRFGRCINVKIPDF